MAYYLEQMDVSLHIWKRKKKPAVFLVLSRFYWELCFIAVKDLVSSMADTYSYHDWIFKSSLLAGNDIGQEVLYIGSATNSLLLLLIAIDATVFYFNKQTDLLRLRLIISIIAQIYPYFCFIPFLYHSIDNIPGNILAFYVLGSSFFICNSIHFSSHNQIFLEESFSRITSN